MPGILRRWNALPWIFALLGGSLNGQTPQGIVLGRIVDSATGLPIAAVSVNCANEATAAIFSTSGDVGGSYALGFYCKPDSHVMLDVQLKIAK